MMYPSYHTVYSKGFKSQVWGYAPVIPALQVEAERLWVPTQLHSKTLSPTTKE